MNRRIRSPERRDPPKYAAVPPAAGTARCFCPVASSHGPVASSHVEVSVCVAWRRSRGGERDRLRGQTNASKDAADDRWLHDRRDETQTPMALRALEGVDVEAPAHQLCPRGIRAARWLRGRYRSGDAGLFVVNGSAMGDDPLAPAGIAGEHSMIDDEIFVRTRDEGREPLEEFDRLEEQVRRAVPPGAL